VQHFRWSGKFGTSGMEHRSGWYQAKTGRVDDAFAALR
jgi:hypothetical protein